MKRRKIYGGKKKYADNKCFIFSADGYEEITYTELCRRQEKDDKYKTKWLIPLHGMLMEVTQEQYREFYKERRRQKYLMEQSVRNKDVSMDALLKQELNGLPADCLVDVAAEAEKNILLKKLKEAMQCLSAEEQLMIGSFVTSVPESKHLIINWRNLSADTSSSTGLF
ncbi:MAG: hypothetical protein NC393_11380 [Clostridium sp.]|nr:hypothetical protein [Clostridium sp.]MCM1208328.1 hypothetical protein [Ruminococcus sp.]